MSMRVAFSLIVAITLCGLAIWASLALRNANPEPLVTLRHQQTSDGVYLVHHVPVLRLRYANRLAPQSLIITLEGRDIRSELRAVPGTTEQVRLQPFPIDVEALRLQAPGTNPYWPPDKLAILEVQAAPTARWWHRLPGLSKWGTPMQARFQLAHRRNVRLITFPPEHASPG